MNNNDPNNDPNKNLFRFLFMSEVLFALSVIGVALIVAFAAHH